MANYEAKVLERDLPDGQFLLELYRRTSKLPFRAENGNELISIDARDCSKEFVREMETFVGARKFKLLVRGSEYYLEVLDGNTFQNVFQKGTP